MTLNKVLKVFEKNEWITDTIESVSYFEGDDAYYITAGFKEGDEWFEVTVWLFDDGETAFYIKQEKDKTAIAEGWYVPNEAIKWYNEVRYYWEYR